MGPLCLCLCVVDMLGTAVALRLLINAARILFAEALCSFVLHVGGWDVDPVSGLDRPLSMCPRCVFLCLYCELWFRAWRVHTTGACVPVCLGLCVPHSGDLPTPSLCVCLHLGVWQGCSGAGEAVSLVRCTLGCSPAGLLPCSRDLCLTTPPSRIFPRDLPGLHELIGTRFSATRDVLGNSYL